jgi:preprotein translocase subunit SecF
MTSITLLLALVSLYVFGGPVIQQFTGAMIWGIVVATASSIFIGGPILIYFNLRPSAFASAEEKEAERVAASKAAKPAAAKPANSKAVKA